MPIILSLTILGAGVLPDGADAANPNGWVAMATLTDDGVSTFDPTKIRIPTRDPGFDDNGNAVTAAAAGTNQRRVIRGGAIIRRQQPNNAQRLNSAASGTRTVYFSLTDVIYPGTQFDQIQAEAGFYGAAPAEDIAAGIVVNNSTLTYPKPLAAALNKQEERATGSGFSWEIYAAHYHARNGRQVACVKAAARDESNNVSATVTVSLPALSDFQPTGFRPEVYKGTTLLAPLNQGETCQLEWEVYPFIGDAGSALKVATDGFAWPTPRAQTKLRFLNDKTGAYGGAHAAVRIGASGGAVALTREGAEAAAFPTIVAALQALQTYNNLNKGHNDHSGSTVWLMEAAAGAGADHSIGNTSAVAAGKCWTEIRKSPSATGVVRAVQGGIDGCASKLCWMVPVHNSGFTGMDGGGGTTKMVAFENMTLSQGGSLQINYQIPLCYWRNVVVTSGPSPFWTFSSVRASSALILGCSNSGDLSGGGIGPYAVLGCDFRGIGLTEFPTSHGDAITHDGAVIANNVLKRQAGPTVLGSTRPVNVGIALVQNVIERANAVATEPGLQIGGDGSVQPLSNVIMHHNTIPGPDIGGRANIFYTDVAGAVGVQKSGTLKFNIFSQYNIKTDTFTTETAVTGRTGNWRMRYGVSSRGNVVILGDTNSQTAPDASGGNPPNGNWLGEYWEPGSKAGAATIGFVDDQSGAARPGSGNYRLAGALNEAYSRVPAGEGVLRFDMKGDLRLQNGTGAAGAFERTDAPPPVEEYPLTITVTDALGDTASLSFTLQVSS